MGQAILCTFHGPSNTQGPRITATAHADSITIAYSLNGRRDDGAPYRDAAVALCEKVSARLHPSDRWPHETLVGGSLPGTPTRWVFTFCEAHGLLRTLADPHVSESTFRDALTRARALLGLGG